MIIIKLLTVVVPSYNSQDYIKHCLDSLVIGGNDVEIIIVDDGSTDTTAEISKRYCEKYPKIVRLAQKENGGHGSAINFGLSLATGLYFKVVDSDDWVEPSAYQAVIKKLRQYSENENYLDLLISNYVYEYFYNGTRKIVNYHRVLPQNTVFGWEQIRKFKVSQLLLMHSLIYRTQLLHDCSFILPEHTFYVDNIFAYMPLPFVKKMAYLDVDFYRYFIGRPDQSVNTANMIKRIDQQLRVTKIMMTMYNLTHDITDKNLRKYMFHYLSMMVTVSIVHINLSNKKETLDKAIDLWQFIKNTDQHLYIVMRRNLINLCLSLPGKSGRYISKKGFSLAQKIYKFS